MNDFKTQMEIASGINAGCSSLSLTSCTLFILLHFKFAELQTFSLRLQSWMCVSDIISSLAWFLIPETIKGSELDSGWRCSTSAFLLNFGQLSSAFWRTIISHAIYSAIVKGHLNQQTAHYYYFIVAFGASLILSCIPFALQNYGPVDYFCWITIDRTKEIESNQLRMSLFYLPIWTLFLIQIILFYKVDAFEKRIAEANNLQHKTHRKFLFYAFVYIITWVAPTLLRTLNGLGKSTQDIFPLACIALITARCHGFASSLQYLFNKRINKLLLGMFAMKEVTTSGNAAPEIEMKDLSKLCQKSIFKEEDQELSPDSRPRSRPIAAPQIEDSKDDIRDRDLSFLSIDM